MRPVSVFVGGLNDDIQKEDLEREFSRFGTLNKVWVARNPPGFAFIEFDDEGDANEAIKEMNGASINGSEIRVDMSRNDGRGRGGRRGGRRGGGGFRGGRDGGFRGGRGGGGGYDSGYSSYGGRGGSRYGGGGDYSRSSYGGGDDYRSSGYRSRSPVGHRNGSGW